MVGTKKDKDLESLRGRVSVALGEEVADLSLGTLEEEDLLALLAEVDRPQTQSSKSPRKGTTPQAKAASKPRGAAAPTAATARTNCKSKSAAAASGPPEKVSAHGLINLGNTCYMNSILQCLSASPFSQELLDRADKGLGSIGQALAAVLEQLNEVDAATEDGTVNPKALLECLAEQHPEYGCRDQQDAHELLRTLLDSLSEELTPDEQRHRGAGTKLPSGATGVCEEMVWANFRGHVCEVRLCWDCCRVSTSLDPFLDLDLAVDLPACGPGKLGVSPAVEGPPAEQEEEQACVRQPSPEKAAKKEEKSDGATQEIRLSRPSTGKRVPWGFCWAERSQAGKLVVASVVPGSLLDCWCRSPGGSPVQPGDRLLSANGISNIEAVREELKDAAEVTLRLRRAPQGDGENGRLKGASTEHGGEDFSQPLFVLEHAKGWAADMKGRMQAAGVTKRDVRVVDTSGVTADPFLSPLEASRFPLTFWRVEDTNTFEVSLERCPVGKGGKPASWGFKWSEEHLARGLLVLSQIPEDSPVGRWNAACRGTRRELALRPGDTVLTANGEKGIEKIRAVIKAVDQLTLTLRRKSGTSSSTSTRCTPETGQGKEGQVAEASEEEQFEVELERSSSSEVGVWGFEWSEERAREAKELVVAGVKEGSAIEDWNSRCEALSQDSQVVHAGDRLVRVNGSLVQREMLRALKTAPLVHLTFAKGRLGRTQLRELETHALSPAAPERSLPPAKLAELEVSRRRLMEAAGRCLESLPSSLRQLFGGDAHAKGKDPLEKRSLLDCLRHFASVEALEDDFAPIYSCGHCGRRTFASKRAWLWPPLPPVLAIHLKRFHFRAGSQQKLAVGVALPAELDLSDLLAGTALLRELSPHLAKGASLPAASCTNSRESHACYELFGACVHRGRTMHRGHYIALANLGPSLTSERWLAFDDAKAWRCQRADVLRAQAYVAFYRRRGS